MEFAKVTVILENVSAFRTWSQLDPSTNHVSFLQKKAGFDAALSCTGFDRRSLRSDSWL